MYSFTGDFRRRPLQDMSGASRNNQRDALLQRAQAERHKREEQRRRQMSAVLIQAYVRSFLTRARQKRHQRVLFDDMYRQLGSKPSTRDRALLIKLLSKLLFFYRQSEDPLRLIWVSQQLLQSHEAVFGWCCCGEGQESLAWRWRVWRLLHLSLLHLVHASPGESGSGAGKESLAVPLRFLEVFSSRQEPLKLHLLSEDSAVTYNCQLFQFLVKKGYFKQLRLLLDSRVPPLMQASSQAPTPLSAFLLEMLTRPLLLTHRTKDQNYTSAILLSFANHLLKAELSEPIRLFVIPALAELPQFPYSELLACLHQPSEAPSLWLLYAVLALEKPGQGLDLLWAPAEGLQYLRVLGWLTEQLTPDGQSARSTPDHHDNDSDSDEEMPDENNLSTTKHILDQCISMMNENGRVQRILQIAEKWPISEVQLSLCRLCHNLLLSHKLGIHKIRLLYTLAFRPSFLHELWQSLINTTQASMFPGLAATPLIRVLARGLELAPHEISLVMPQLATFCALFSLLLSTMHDNEFSSDDELPGSVSGAMPFTVEELVPLSAELKGVCLGLIRLAYPESRPAMREDYRSAVRPSSAAASGPGYLQPSTQTWGKLFKAAVDLLQQLHARDTRRPYCPKDHWLAQEVTLPASEIGCNRLNLRKNYRPFRKLRLLQPISLEDGPPLSTKEVRNMAVLQEMPFVISFEQRVKLLQELVNQEKNEFQPEPAFNVGPSIQIIVRRNYLYEDAFDKLSPENEPELRNKMRVQLVNVAGLDEAGVDGGGVFREFLSELLKIAFDPNRGFFRLTKDNMLYPNPSVHLLVENFLPHYYFIGRIVGKALFENLLVELPLADFFLSKLVCGGASSDVDMHHLASLDPVLYRNLLLLKTHEGDVADLDLDFTIVLNEFGETKIEELKPGGANIQVTASNRIEYIHLMADYKLNKQIRAQCNAFKQGLANVIPLEWLQMFNNKEIQVLISGAPIPVDVEDLRRNTHYAGVFTEEHPTIQALWKVVEKFSDLQRRQLLKFVTSCSRPPLLGFKELLPPFCVHSAGAADRLPTASTCMNLLKLPEFKDEDTLREKLLYAIQSGAGFELS